MATLVGSGKQIADNIQAVANRLGKLPTAAEYAAQPDAMQMYRINAFFKSFDKALSHVTDPAPRVLSAAQATRLIERWSISAKQLPSAAAWKQSIKAGLKIASWDEVLAAAGIDRDGAQTLGHNALCNSGLSPIEGGRRYAKKAPAEKAVTREARSAVKGVKRRTVSREQLAAERAEDRKINAELAAEAAARREAGIRQGRVQTAADRAGRAAWAAA